MNDESKEALEIFKGQGFRVAPFWLVWLAKIFGQTVIVTSNNTMVVGHKWRGRLYLEYFEHTEPRAQGND